MIIHFTTVHPRVDSRIRDKELASLQRAFGGPVAMYVQDGLGGEIDRRAGFAIVDTGPPLRRMARMTVGAWRMIKAVIAARPQVAHFHDPELLPWAIVLRLWGIKVIYDVHEDVPRQVKHSTGMPPWARTLLPPFVSLTEWIGARLVNGIAAASPVIGDRFPAERTMIIRNYPLVDELHAPDPKPMGARPVEFAYIGMITVNRNIFGMIDAISRVSNPEVRLRLAGRFALEENRRQAEAMPGWNNVDFVGWTSREGIASILADARAGLLVLKPVEHEMVTLPIKLFEYMAAGIPVIASDFPVWRKIIEGAGCGLLVDPDDTDAIVAAMDWIIDNPEKAQAMGDRGRRAVVEQLNWDAEAKTLTDFYRERLGLRHRPQIALA